jgi:hypothetical protein
MDTSEDRLQKIADVENELIDIGFLLNATDDLNPDTLLNFSFDVTVFTKKDTFSFSKRITDDFIPAIRAVLKSRKEELTQKLQNL